VRTEQGIRSFTQGDIDKRGIKIIRDGQQAQLSDFHVGDKLTATIVTSHPPKVVTEKDVQATLARAATAAPPSAPAPSAAAPGAPAASTPAAAGEPRTLPKTASRVPLIALLGLTALITGGLLTIRRRQSMP
jgi:LPXTG-motif cell wall-anchored protein